jgi:uncharacterized oligopeptide transporter (OPT) family protein
VLHSQGRPSSKDELDAAAQGGFASLVPKQDSMPEPANNDTEDEENQQDKPDWASNMRLLLICFGISGLFTLLTYFFPILRNLPVFGPVAAHAWLWTFNPSFAYIGQGIIMGTETTLHMALGAIVGWGVLSPIAKAKGWAPGDVSDWEHGSKGWIVWISLAIMLVDAVVSLAYIALRPLYEKYFASTVLSLQQKFRNQGIKGLWRSHQYSPLFHNNETGPDSPDDDDDAEYETHAESDEEADDAPEDQRIGNKSVTIGLLVSIAICVLTIHIVFGDLVPLYATIIAVLMALVLSIMGVRALGETDLNPVSGISKLAQLFFAFIIPQSNKSSVLINLIAGAVVSL